MVLIGNSLIPEVASETALASTNRGWFRSASANKLLIRFIDDGSEQKIVASATLLDSDDDGLNDPREAQIGSDIDNPDTDNDFQGDFMEVAFGTDPTDPASRVSLTSGIAIGEPPCSASPGPASRETSTRSKKCRATPPRWSTIAERIATETITEFLYPMTESRALLRVRPKP